MSEVLVQAENISKKFCRSLKRSLFYGLKDMVGEVVGRDGNHSRLRCDEFWAVKNVSFQLHRGECMGLIGRNGAGKTTLLRMLNGLIKPDAGKITMKGRVGALIALGAGFNPILTGRENIYVNGSILGLNRSEIDAKVDEIVEFAELHEFIDSPVRNYSSGMNVRLGFSIASSLSPDVLILDEVLAVGDFVFRMKCYERVNQLIRSAAVIFVSHQPDHIRRMCTTSLYLKRGELAFAGSVAEALARYDEDAADATAKLERFVDPTFADIQVGISRSKISFRDPLEMSVECLTTTDHTDLLARILFFSGTEEVAGEWISKNHGLSISISSGKRTSLKFSVASVSLRPGKYKVGLVLAPPDNRHYLVNIRNCAPLEISGPTNMLHFRQL